MGQAAALSIPRAKWTFRFRRGRKRKEREIDGRILGLAGAALCGFGDRTDLGMAP